MNTNNQSTKLLDSLQLPQGLRALSERELIQIASELRDELIESIAATGGHFASSLGALEIAVALHHFFDTPKDRIIWDVGHQAYVHKMLTGRRDNFRSIRKQGGISGFLKRGESEYDTFGAGHAGTSISAAVGMAVALRQSDPERKVVAVIGDASIGNGMALEALNHAGDLCLPNLIVILNDNEMSISPNVGALSRLLSAALTSGTSTWLRNKFKQMFREGYVPEVVYKAMDRAEEVTQGFFSGASMLFEAFGFRFIGPIDGNNIPALLSALAHAKRQDVPVLIHAQTVKGKGYEPAEQDPELWHGVAPFDRCKGEFIAAKATRPGPKLRTFTQIFSDTLTDLAKQDERIVGITAAMAGGTGLDQLQRELPKQFFDVGICEEHAVTFAAGLACEGKRPICAIYSTFLQRAFDQVLHDVCLQNLPVVFALDRAGLVGADGETHQGLFDMSYMRALPNMTVMSPKDENELRHMLFSALRHNGPVALRYPRGYGIGCELEPAFKLLEHGRAEIVQRGERILIICFGPVIKGALKAAERLAREDNLIPTIVNARFAKPLDIDLLKAEICKHEHVFTIEDHSLAGGFGSAVNEMIQAQGILLKNPLVCFGVADRFVPHATQEEQYQMCGLDAEAIFNKVASEVRTLRFEATTKRAS